MAALRPRRQGRTPEPLRVYHGLVPPQGSTPQPPPLDVLLSPQFVEELDILPMSAVRERRDRCGLAESELSYVRRLVQGWMDILRAEQQRRASGTPSEAGAGSDLLDRLPGVLAEHGSSPRPGRARAILGPELTAGELTRQWDQLVSADDLTDPTSMTPERLVEVVEAMSAFEAEVSGTRRALHAQIDLIQAEIIRRYRDGEARVDDLID